jgi:hypothetical protein
VKEKNFRIKKLDFWIYQGFEKLWKEI